VKFPKAGIDWKRETEGEGFTVEASVAGFRLTRERDEERDAVGGVVAPRERRHVWHIVHLDTQGEYVGEVDLSTDWEPVMDMSDLPGDYKKAPTTEVKQQPFIQMSVPKAKLN